MTSGQFKIIIPGSPIPQERPRFFNNGRFTRMYDPQARKKKQAAFIISSQSNNLNLMGPNVFFSVDFTFLMPIPKSTSKAQKNILKWLPCHDEKPDVDNLIKFYLDASNGTLWKDDKSIYQVSAQKFYSDTPRVIMKVTANSKEELQKSSKEILSMFSPEEFNTFVEDVKRIYTKTSPADIQKNPCEAAVLISLFADHYGDRLKSIKTKHPEAWKKINSVRDI